VLNLIRLSVVSKLTDLVRQITTAFTEYMDLKLKFRINICVPFILDLA